MERRTGSKNKKAHNGLRLAEEPPGARIGAMISAEEGEKLKALIREINEHGQRRRRGGLDEDPEDLPPAA